MTPSLLSRLCSHHAVAVHNSATVAVLHRVIINFPTQVSVPFISAPVVELKGQTAIFFVIDFFFFSPPESANPLNEERTERKRQVVFPQLPAECMDGVGWRGGVMD